MPLRVCPSCYKEFFFGDVRPIECRHCGARYDLENGELTPSTDTRSEAERALEAVERRRLLIEKVAVARRSGQWDGMTDDEAREAASDIILTTSIAVAGYETQREIDIVAAECVFGINVLKDILISARDTFGGRSETMQKVLRDARQRVLAELRREALMAGADAVIAVDLDYQEFSGGAAMLMIIASGTAVKLRQQPPPASVLS